MMGSDSRHERFSQDELPRAAEQLRRIGGYFASRIGWPTTSESRSTLESILEQVKQLAELVDGEIDRAGLVRHARQRTAAMSAIPEGRLDVGRLQRFLSHLTQTYLWLGNRTGAPLREEGRHALLQVHSSLALLAESVSAILGLPPATAPEPDQKEASVAETPPPTRAGAFVAGGMRATEPAQSTIGDRMPLVGTAADPVVIEGDHGLRLTELSAAKIRSFATANGLHLEGHALRKLEEKVVQWVAGTPTGQVLELRMSHLQGRPNLYPSYVRAGGSGRG